MTDAPKMKTTAKERAAEAVNVLQRRRKKLIAKQRDLEDQKFAIAADLAQVEEQLDYAAANPLLKNVTAPAPEETNGHT